MKPITVFSWSLVFLWMALIFYLSSQTGSDSGGMSGRITETVLGAVQATLPSLDVQPEMFHTLVRKSAHFFAYFVLALLAFNAVRRSGARGGKAYLTAFAIAALYAASDEFHQSFVPGRGPAVTDVFIDSAGAATALFICWLVLRSSVKMPGRIRRLLEN